MKTCPSCQTANDRDARFCINCRYLFMEQKPVCPNGHTMDAFWPECYICKHEAAAAGASSASAASSNAFTDRVTPSPAPASSLEPPTGRRETVIDPMGMAGSRIPPPVAPSPILDPISANSAPASPSAVRPRRQTSYAPAPDPGASAGRIPASAPFAAGPSAAGLSAAEPGAGRRIVGILVT